MSIWQLIGWGLFSLPFLYAAFWVIRQWRNDPTARQILKDMLEGFSFALIFMVWAGACFYLIKG